MKSRRRRGPKRLDEIRYSLEKPGSMLACKIKGLYKTKGRAKSAASRETKRAGRPINFYKCPCCSFFHLTSRVQ